MENNSNNSTIKDSQGNVIRASNPILPHLAVISFGAGMGFLLSRIIKRNITPFVVGGIIISYTSAMVIELKSAGKL